MTPISSRKPQPPAVLPGIVFVHLCSGEVVPVSPATGVVVKEGQIIVYDNEDPVACYDRRDVYSCSKTETCPCLS